MSYVIDKILGKTEQDENNSSRDSARDRSDVGGAQSYSEFKASRRQPYNGNVDVSPCKFDSASMYPEDEISRDQRQSYPEQDRAYPGARQDAGYGQDYDRQGYQGYPQSDYPRADYSQKQSYADERQYQRTEEQGSGYYEPRRPYGTYSRPFYKYVEQDEGERRVEFDNKLASVNGYSRDREQIEQPQDDRNRRKARKKPNAKATIILALYLIVVAVVITLIGINAGKINSGKAVVPASEVAAEVSYDAPNYFDLF